MDRRKTHLRPVNAVFHRSLEQFPSVRSKARFGKNFISSTKSCLKTAIFSAAGCLVLLGSISAPSRAAATSSIILTWPTPSVVMLTGAQVAIYGNIVGSTTGVTPWVAIQNSATGQWAHADGTWGAQQWLLASIVDQAGDWRYLLTPTLSGAFNLSVALQDTSGTVISTANHLPGSGQHTDV